MSISLITTLTAAAPKARLEASTSTSASGREVQSEVAYMPIPSTRQPAALIRWINAAAPYRLAGMCRL